MPLPNLCVIDVSEWEAIYGEPRGARTKYWIREPDASLWLRKEPHAEKPFQSISEVLALGIANEVGVPAPGGVLCKWMEDGTEKNGVIVRSFCGSDDFAQGADVVSGVDPTYDVHIREAHTLERVRLALQKKGADPSVTESLLRAFAAILTLDAWLGIQDRHAGNWGLITTPTPPQLAPFYDGAACLGSELNASSLERKRAKVVEYVQRCPSGFGDGTKTVTQSVVFRELLEKWSESTDVVRSLTRSFRKLLDGPFSAYLRSTPEGLLPPPRVEFVLTVLKLRLEFMEGEIGE